MSNYIPQIVYSCFPNIQSVLIYIAILNFTRYSTKRLLTSKLI